MGYYTYFTLNIYEADKSEQLKEVQELMPALKDNKTLSKISTSVTAVFYNSALGIGVLKSFEGEDGYQPFDDHTSWQHTNKCVEVSKKYPNLLLEVYGEGEDREDSWIEVYHNGKIISEWRVDVHTPGIEELLSKYKTE